MSRLLPMLGAAAAIATTVTLVAPVAAVAHADPFPDSAAFYGDIAYQAGDPSHTLVIVTPDDVLHGTGLGMAAGTSPSIAQNPDHQGYTAAMQANTATLWEVGSDNVGHPQKVAMRAGSNPTVQVDEDGNRQVLFDDRATGRLGTIDQRDRISLDSDLIMADRSSPSTGTGSPCVGTPAGTHLVMVCDEDQESPVYLAAGTTIATAAARDGGHDIDYTARAWNGADGFLHYRCLQDHRVIARDDASLRLAPGTSPAIAVTSQGGCEVVGTRTDGWLAGADGGIDPGGTPPPPYKLTDFVSGLGMDVHSSPSITARRAGRGTSFQIAFQANDHTLWVTDGIQGADTRRIPGTSMAPGTSPSINSFMDPLPG